MFTYQPGPSEARLHNLLDLAQKVCNVRASDPYETLNSALNEAADALAAQITAVSAEINKQPATPESAPAATTPSPRLFKVGDRVRVKCITYVGHDVAMLGVGDKGKIEEYDATGDDGSERQCWYVLGMDGASRRYGYHADDELELTAP
jgi:hypothetical protein